MARGLIVAQVIGSEKLREALEQLPERAAHALGAGLYAVGNNLMTEAKRQAPVDFGTLKGSGYVTPPVIEGNVVTVELGFGGPAGQYAAVQHEGTEFRHEVGKAKFLEDPVNASAGSFASDVQAVAARALEAGIAGPPAAVPVADGGHPTTPTEGTKAAPARRAAKRARKKT